MAVLLCCFYTQKEFNSILYTYYRKEKSCKGVVMRNSSLSFKINPEIEMGDTCFKRG